MDYKKEYLIYKKKYLELKKKIQNKQSGGMDHLSNEVLQPSYLNFGPTDGYVVDSDNELQQQLSYTKNF